VNYPDLKGFFRDAYLSVLAVGMRKRTVLEFDDWLRQARIGGRDIPRIQGDVLKALAVAGETVSRDRETETPEGGEPHGEA